MKNLFTRITALLLCAFSCCMAFAGCAGGNSGVNAIIGEWYDENGNCFTIQSDNTYKIDEKAVLIGYEIGSNKGAWKYLEQENIFKFSANSGYTYEIVPQKDEYGTYIDYAYYGRFYKDGYPKALNEDALIPEDEQVDAIQEEIFETPEPTPAEINDLAQILLDHRDEWEFFPKEFAKEYTYDDIPVAALSILTGEKQGEYYFAPLYRIRNGSLSWGEYLVFHITEDSFVFIEKATKDEQVSNLGDYLVALYTLNSKESFENQVCSFASNAVSAESRHFYSLELHTEDVIEFTLTEAQENIYNCMFNVITGSEFKVFNKPLLSNDPDDGDKCSVQQIVFYCADREECIMYLQYGLNSYIYMGDPVGFEIYSDHYIESENVVSVLKNTTNTQKLYWDYRWTSEKKEYTLKKFIFENYPY